MILNSEPGVTTGGLLVVWAIKFKAMTIQVVDSK